MVFFDLRREEDLDVAILSVLTKGEESQIGSGGPFRFQRERNKGLVVYSDSRRNTILASLYSRRNAVRV